MRHAGQPELLDHVMAATVPMRARMIHGAGVTGELYEQSQDYDAQGKVLRPSSSAPSCCTEGV